MTDVTFKILLIGDAGVGKSSLLVRFINDVYNEGPDPAVGIDFLAKTIELDGKKIKMQVWDTAGQERFRTITSSYYRGAHGVILMYDVLDKVSFENVKRWVSEIDRYAGEDTPKFLVGTKIDDSNRQVSPAEGQDLADSLSIPWTEVSAKANTNVTGLFELVARALLKKTADETAPPPKPTVDVKQTTKDAGKKKDKGGSCVV